MLEKEKQRIIAQSDAERIHLLTLRDEVIRLFQLLDADLVKRRIETLKKVGDN